MKHHGMDRRKFLGVASAAALGLGGALVGCGSGEEGTGGSSPSGGSSGMTTPSDVSSGIGNSSAVSSSGAGSPSGSGSSGGGLTLPAYVPYTGLKPDLPGLPNGTAPYYKTIPALKDRPKFWQGPPPGKGGDFSVLTFMNNTPKVVSDNKWWQAVNKAVNANIKINGAPVGDYPAKFTVTIAGGDLPDAAVLYPSVMPGLGPTLKADFADLTEYLGGDAIKAYPALANLPSYCWEACVYNGVLSAVPLQRPALETGDVLRVDLIEGDASPTPKNGNELLALLKALTNKKKTKYATVYVWGLLYRFAEMKGVPNVWAVDASGKFTKDYETAQFKESLDVTRQCWANGYIHPIAFQPNYSTQAHALMSSGKVGYVTSRYSGNPDSLMRLIKDEWHGTPGWFAPTKWEGGVLDKRYVGTGAPYMTAIKKSDPDRIKEILSIMDWFAAPWGTQENALKTGGIEGHDFTVEPSGAFKQTDVGKAESIQPLAYIGAAPGVHYDAAEPQFAKLAYDAENLGMSHAEKLPTLGLESATDQKSGVALDSKVQNSIADIIQGRKSVSDWDGVVKSWRSGGGDTIRKEYEQAWSKKNG